MPRKKTIPKTEDKFQYYLYGVLIGIVFLTVFNLTYILANFRIPDTNSFFSHSSFRYNNPQTINIPVLMYHYVEVVKDPGDTIRKGLSILPWTFEEQVKSLKEAGYTFLTPKDLESILSDKTPLPKKPIILSFDDGYSDFYTDVFPILKKYNVKAVQYVISGFFDQTNYLTRDQFKEISSSDLIEIGCHTMHHPALASVGSVEAQEEIYGCRRDIKNEFGINVVSFAYPYGSYDPFLFPIVKDSGFTNAVTTEAGTNISRSNIYNLPRLRPGNRIGLDLTLYLESSMIASKNLSSFIKTANASEK